MSDKPVSETVKLTFDKCNHHFEMISPINMKCILCGAGYMGKDLDKLKQLFSECGRLSTDDDVPKRSPTD